MNKPTAKQDETAQSEEPAPKDALPGIEAGHYVRLADRALVDMSKMTPVRLFKLGWPNKFQVMGVGRDPKTGGQVIKIDPCCDYTLQNHRGKPLCPRRTPYLIIIQDGYFVSVVMWSSRPTDLAKASTSWIVKGNSLW